jgi:CRISPR system Cascade subunit CasE
MELDMQSRQTMRALASPSVLHGMVETSFTGERSRNLWRLDTLRGKTYLLLLSPERPDMLNAYSQIGARDTEEPWQTKDYDAYIASIQSGDALRFRLTANPTYSHHEPDEKPGNRPRGQVCAHITTEHQKNWLADRAKGLGFAVDDNNFDVTESRWRSFRKGKDRGRPVDLLSVTFEGELTVTDAEQFRKTLINGIGRGKAYGMGLMTVIRRKNG